MAPLSGQLATALEAVAAGRVQYGNVYPKMARRRRHGSTIDWLLDGCEVYGGEHSTYGAAERRDLIVVRHDLLPTAHVPEQTRQTANLAGHVTTSVLPAHDEPADPGWRAGVELTEAGRKALDEYLHNNRRD